MDPRSAAGGSRSGPSRCIVRRRSRTGRRRAGRRRTACGCPRRGAMPSGLVPVCTNSGSQAVARRPGALPLQTVRVDHHDGVVLVVEHVDALERLVDGQVEPGASRTCRAAGPCRSAPSRSRRGRRRCRRGRRSRRSRSSRPARRSCWWTRRRAPRTGRSSRRRSWKWPRLAQPAWVVALHVRGVDGVETREGGDVCRVGERVDVDVHRAVRHARRTSPVRSGSLRGGRRCRCWCRSSRPSRRRSSPRRGSRRLRRGADRRCRRRRRSSPRAASRTPTVAGMAAADVGDGDRVVVDVGGEQRVVRRRRSPGRWARCRRSASATGRDSRPRSGRRSAGRRSPRRCCRRGCRRWG